MSHECFETPLASRYASPEMSFLKLTSKLLTILAFFIAIDSLVAQDLPVDVSFIAIDMKYSKKRGPLICEIQSGVSSTFRGETFSNGGYSIIASNLLQELSRFFPLSWVDCENFSDSMVKQEFKKSPKWKNIQIGNLQKKYTFIKNAKAPVLNREDLSSYHGFLFFNSRKLTNRKILTRLYPGVVFIDNAINPFRNNKYKMSSLLLGHPETERRKPKWGAYPAEYTPDLSLKIQSDIPSDFFVIKPLNGYKGKGVIILSKEGLDATLKTIFSGNLSQEQLEDPSYSYWLEKKQKNFIVEEYVPSDPIPVPHFGGKLYSPTLRLVYLLMYSQKQINIVLLGGYNFLPMKSIEEEGTMNEKYKAYCVIPHYWKAEPKVIDCADSQLQETLQIIYSKMLGIDRI